MLIYLVYFIIEFGFKRVSEWFDEKVEFGPNCFVEKDLNV